MSRPVLEGGEIDIIVEIRGPVRLGPCWMKLFGVVVLYVPGSKME